MTSRSAIRDDAQACLRAYEALRSHVLVGEEIGADLVRVLASMALAA